MRALLVSVAVGLWSAAAWATPSIQGTWLTDDHKAEVRIAPCGQQMCGTIARVLVTGPNVQTRDANNPDPRLRGRSIVGMTILSGFARSGAAWTGGRAYDPKTGRSYRTTLGLNTDGSLNVTGCVLFICQSRRWTRAR